MNNPCDWDLETYCVICKNPATHKKIFGLADETPIYEFVCCECAEQKENQ